MSQLFDQSSLSPEGQVKRNVRSLVERFNYELKELDAKRLKQLKNLVKNDQNLIEPLVASLFEALHRPDSDRRLAALLICDQFFIRSHKFRETLIADFQDFLLYTAETDALRNPLPSPKAAAKLLKSEAIKIVRQWHDKFGPAYKKLELAYGFLKQCKTLDFERLDAETLVERQRTQEAAERKERMQQKIAQKIAEDFEGIRLDLERRLTEAKNAINLLFPEFCPTDQVELLKPSDSTLQNRQENLQLHGIASTDHHVTVEVNLSGPAVQTTDDNAALVDAVVDSKKLLEKDLRKLNKWLQQLAKVGGRSSEQLSKRLIDLKNDCATQLGRCQDLNLPLRTRRIESTAKKGSDSDDSDFEDVPEKEGLELDFKHPTDDDRVPQHILDHLRDDVDDSDKPGPSGLNSTNFKLPVCRKTAEQGSSDVPTLAFGLDLKYWGQDDVEIAAMPKNNADCHRFWRNPDESDVTDGTIDIYRTRVITFGGKFKPVERECRHPLADGSVCLRKDRVKCPFHGIIIERDMQGNAVMHRDDDSGGRSIRTSNDKRDPSSSAPTNREEAEYLRDVERGTGGMLGGSKSSTNAPKERRKKRQPTEAQMARDRLQTRLFNKSALKRVGDTLDAVQDARNKQKFGQQFTYSISHRKI